MSYLAFFGMFGHVWVGLCKGLCKEGVDMKELHMPHPVKYGPADCASVNRRDGYCWSRKNGPNRARTARFGEFLKWDWEESNGGENDERFLRTATRRTG
jgi:hypothetical protein